MSPRKWAPKPPHPSICPKPEAVVATTVVSVERLRTETSRDPVVAVLTREIMAVVVAPRGTAPKEVAAVGADAKAQKIANSPEIKKPECLHSGFVSK
jgi:hypothetical protein